MGRPTAITSWGQLILENDYLDDVGMIDDKALFDGYREWLEYYKAVQEAWDERIAAMGAQDVR